MTLKKWQTIVAKTLIALLPSTAYLYYIFGRKTEVWHLPECMSCESVVETKSRMLILIEDSSLWSDPRTFLNLLISFAIFLIIYILISLLDKKFNIT